VSQSTQEQSEEMVEMRRTRDLNRQQLTAQENIWVHKNQILSLGSFSWVCRLRIS
jgi:hypothetical protein